MLGFVALNLTCEATTTTADKQIDSAANTLHRSNSHHLKSLVPFFC